MFLNLFCDAADAKTVRTIVIVHVAVGDNKDVIIVHVADVADEEQTPTVRCVVRRTAPVVAVCACAGERTSRAEA